MSSKTQGDSQADKNIEIDPAKRKPKMGSQFQHVTLPPTPESIAFAGEVLPIHIDDVRERLEKELIRNSFYHSNTLDYIKRANRFFSIIDPILEKEGIPLDFKYLAVAESGLYNPTSPAGAKGLWQFMSTAGKAYGLEISSQVDERYNYEKSTLAACKYLKKLHSKFGSWTMAAAAYNMGPTSLSKAVRSQKETEYFNLNLNQETMKYVFRICAIKQIMENPEVYGFYLRDEELLQPLPKARQFVITESIPSLGDWAHTHSITYRDLKIYNPWLRDSGLTVSAGKKYVIEVPFR